MKFAFIFLIALVLLFAGCVSSRFEAVGETKYSPYPSSHPVTIYKKSTWMFTEQAKKDIGQPILPSINIPSHEVIGKIVVDGAPAAGVNSIIKEAQKRARELGADAIVLDEWKDVEKQVRSVKMSSHHLYVDAVRLTQK